MVYSPRRMIRALLPFTLAYQAGSRANNLLFDWGLRKIRRASLPVISVGNTAFGGSEKTPLVMHLLSFFLKQGSKPALVSRGYKGGWEKSGGILSDGKNVFGTWHDAGDEPFMVFRNLPQAGIYVGRNRWISCEKARYAGFDVIILDDGFQHRKLHRDLDIVLFNPDAGISREPVSSLKRADMVLVKTNDHSLTKDPLESRFPEAKVFFYSVKNKGFFRYPDNEEVPKDLLIEKRLLAICGIARPRRFFSLLEKEGLRPISSLSFSDHHAYPVSSQNRIIGAIQKTGADALLTTEKDVFKLDSVRKTGQVPVYYNKIDLQVEENFYREVRAALKEG